jgi:aminoglycoside phosphotransferase (APT) family kinase protein
MSPTPTEAHALEIATAFRGEAPASVRRFPLGLAHWVYDVVFIDDSRIVVRMTTPEQRLTFQGVVHWSETLRPLGVPLPALLGRGELHGFPYLVLERLEGEDLRVVYATLSSAQRLRIATELSRVQGLVAALPEGPGYGYVCLPHGPYETSWRSVLNRILGQSKARIESAGRVSMRTVQRVEQRAADFERYFAAVVPTPFLDDTTTKNVIVHAGALSGIVDVDEMAFGDPLLTIGLTRASLLAAGHDCEYTDMWSALLSLTREQSDVVRFYAALFGVVFLGELGEAFNRELPTFDEELCARLERLVDEHLS